MLSDGDLDAQRSQLASRRDALVHDSPRVVHPQDLGAAERGVEKHAFLFLDPKVSLWSISQNAWPARAD